MKEKKNKKTLNNRAWTTALIYMVVMLSFFSIKDFVKNVIADKSDYEIRYESDEDTKKEQKLYRLYINDIYCKDVDINNYSYIDPSGNTDYKYCALTEDANALTSTLLLTAMMVLVVFIAKESVEKTPFTHANVKRIKTIAILQLLFAVLPGMVTFVMTMARFLSCHGSFNIKWLYLFIISAITALIANVFQYGVKLQEDSDSIA